MELPPYEVVVPKATKDVEGWSVVHVTVTVVPDGEAMTAEITGAGATVGVVVVNVLLAEVLAFPDESVELTSKS